MAAVLIVAPPDRIVGTVLLPGGSLRRAVVHVAAGRIEAVEVAPRKDLEWALRRDDSTLRLGAHDVLAPAFVDVHCHGAGGGSAHGDTTSLRRMARALRGHGVGGFLVTTMTAAMADLRATARRVAHLAESPAEGADGGRAARVLGLHLEGPALSPRRSAGHDPEALLSPAQLWDALTGGADDWRAVRVVTLAPELDGGLELVRRLAEAGMVASLGHTDADVATATAAYAAGARSTTHLFNAMAPLHHRSPGPVGAALAAAPWIELICDGIHVERALLAPVVRAIGEDRLVLVSDALPLAGSRLREVALPGGPVRVRGGRAVSPDGSLAGSRLLLDGMVASAVRSGIPLAVALRAATENPARLLGPSDRGALRPGALADFVVVSDAGRLKRVLAA